MQEEQKEQAAKDSKPYYDNDLVVAKPDGAPVSASWVSSQFGKLLEDLDMPHIRFHDLRHPYVKHTTKNISLQKQKARTIKANLVVWAFCFYTMGLLIPF